MDRTLARTHAMQLVYENDMGGVGGEDTRLNLLCIDPDKEDIEFMNALFEGVQTHKAEIDERISKYLRGWTIERLSRVDLAVLRVAVCELLFIRTEAAIVINEAVELAKKYSNEKSGAFINGVLGNLARAET